MCQLSGGFSRSTCSGPSPTPFGSLRDPVAASPQLRSLRIRLPAQTGPDLGAVRHDLSDLRQDTRVGDRIDGFLTEMRRRTDVFVQHPDDAPNIIAQLRRILPAEGWLTERLARLREQAHHFRKGHAARIEQLRDVIGRLPRAERKKAAAELTARYAELQLDKRLALPARQVQTLVSRDGGRERPSRDVRQEPHRFGGQR